MHKMKIFGSMFAAATAMMLIGCETPTKVTGGGKVVPYGSYASEKATFGFNANACGDSVTGQFQFHDHTIRIDGDIKFHGEVGDAAFCEDPSGISTCGYCFDGELKVEATYESTNPFFPGFGTATACVRDGGEGADAVDTIFLALDSGPFDGYRVEGELKGNIQDHGCE